MLKPARHSFGPTAVRADAYTRAYLVEAAAVHRAVRAALCESVHGRWVLDLGKRVRLHRGVDAYREAEAHAHMYVGSGHAACTWWVRGEVVCTCWILVDMRGAIARTCGRSGAGAGQTRAGMQTRTCSMMSRTSARITRRNRRAWARRKFRAWKNRTCGGIQAMKP